MGASPATAVPTRKAAEMPRIESVPTWGRVPADAPSSPSCHSQPRPSRAAELVVIRRTLPKGMVDDVPRSGGRNTPGTGAAPLNARHPDLLLLISHMRVEETHHFPCRIRAFRIGVR